MADRATIGIIGGSGLYAMEGLEDVEEVNPQTPFGPTSDVIILGNIGEQRLAFLPRHGRGHRLLPSEVPVRANIYALKALGVRRVISVSAVGSMREEVAPNVVAAESGEAALAALQGSAAFDTVITDVGLPGMSGWELLAVLRNHYPDVAVIVASGWVGEGDAKMAAAVGLPRDRLLGKPYRAAMLLAAVDNAGRALDAEGQPRPPAS